MTTESIKHVPSSDLKQFKFLLDPLRRAYIEMALGCALISFSAVFVRLSTTGPTVDGVYRMLFGGLFLALIAIFKRQPFWRGAKAYVYIIASAFFISLDLIFWHRSIGHIGPGLATILGNFQVFILALVGVFIFKDRVSAKFIAAIPLALIGMYLLVGFKWHALSPMYRLGIYQGLVTAVGYAFHVVTLRKSQLLPTSLKPLPNLAVVSLFSASMLVLVALGEGESFVIPNVQNWIWLLCYGLFGQGMGWLLIARSLPKVSISIAGFFILLQPSLSLLWDILLFHRPIEPIEILGVFVVLIAIYMSATGRRQASE